MASANPEHRSLIASIAANEGWAKTTDRTARTAPGRHAMERRWLDMADGDPKRAENLRRAHFKRMALASAKARAAKKAVQA